LKNKKFVAIYKRKLKLQTILYDEEVKQGFQCLRELIKEDFDKVYELFDSILTSAFDPNIITSFLSNKITI
jgi:hypothetical protein